MPGILADRELRSQLGILRRSDRGIPTYQIAGTNTWTLAGARHMLQIRASLMSSRFASDFQHSLPGRPHLDELPAAA